MSPDVLLASLISAIVGVGGGQGIAAIFRMFSDKRVAEANQELSEDEAVATARDIWTRINGENLTANILPTRARARLVLRKAADHSVSTVLVRKV